MHCQVEITPTGSNFLRNGRGKKHHGYMCYSSLLFLGTCRHAMLCMICCSDLTISDHAMLCMICCSDLTISGSTMLVLAVTKPRVHKAFQVQDQAQVSKWTISGLFPIICSRKLDSCIHWHGKCCLRPKMHNIKVHVGDN